MTIAIKPAHSFSYDGARINVYHAEIGEGLPKHSHIYDHASFCTSGSMVIRKEGKEVVVDKYTQPINLVHGEWHEIEALENGTVFINVFSEKYNAE